MKKVWIFQTGEPIHIDKNNMRPMRAINLANYLVQNNCRVTLWSSNFYHQKKTHRFSNFKSIKINSLLTIKLISSPGYKKNISFRRIYDHIILAYNLSKVLKTINEKPDYIIIGYPPIETSYVLINWALRYKVKTIIDVKDQWPENFTTPFPKYLRPLSRLILQPYFFIARYIFNKSNYISTISKGFEEWISSLIKSDLKEKIFLAPLTSPLIEMNKKNYQTTKSWWENHGLFQDKKTICFVGSLSRAFDFKPIQSLMQFLSDKNLDINLVICGYGEETPKIKQLMKNHKNVFFPGWINSNQMKVLFDNSTCMLAPYKNYEDFKKSIPNKIYDALAFGLPIVSSLEGNVKDLIDKYKVGVHYKNDEDLCNKVSKLLIDKKFKDKISSNSNNLYNKHYSYDLVYKKFLEIIL